MFKSILKSIFLVGAGLALGACVTRADIDEIKKTQEDILKKVEAVQKTAGRAAPVRPTRPTGPDPSKIRFATRREPRVWRRSSSSVSCSLRIRYARAPPSA